MADPVFIEGNPGDQFAQGVTKTLPFGTLMMFPDGRKFRYASAGELLVVGETLQSSATLTDIDLVCAGNSVGDASISVTSVTTAAANFYAEGFVGLNKGDTLGRCYQVLSHALLTGGAGDLIYITDPNGLTEAISAADEATLIASPYKNVITHPATTESACAIGVACEDIASASYGWIQRGGVACVLATNGADGDNFVAVSGTGGRGEVQGGDAEPAIGICIAPSTAAGEGALIYLTLD